MKIAILNQKGGVGKTTISVNLAYGLANLGKRTLLIDLDPQAHSSVIYSPPVKPEATVRELFLSRNFDIRTVITPAAINGEAVSCLSIIPSSIHLAITAEQVITQTHREKLLHNHLKKIATEFDFILLDCPPTLNVLTVNAIYTADLILIPTTYGIYSLDGIADLFKSINDVKEGDAYAFHIVRNGYDSRNKQSNEFIEQNLEPFRSHILETLIRRTEAVNQAQMNREPIFTFDPASKGTEDFKSLTQELIRHA